MRVPLCEMVVVVLLMLAGLAAARGFDSCGQNIREMFYSDLDEDASWQMYVEGMVWTTNQSQEEN